MLKPTTPMPASTPAPMQPASPSGNPGGQPHDISTDMAPPAPHVPSVAAIATGDRLTPVEAEPVTPAEPIVLHYIGDGMHTVPGLPGRDLTQYDIDTSPYRNEPWRILKFTPPVYSAGAQTTADEPTLELVQSTTPPLPFGGSAILPEG